jgi:hypothetical protein
MKIRRILIAMLACGLLTFALGAGSAQAAKKGPKPKLYTYCVSNGTEGECFEKEPVEVFRKTHTWSFGSETTGTYTQTGKSYVFTETGGSHDELRGTRGRQGVISGTLYEGGSPSEFTFTLTPRH